ncbi:DUF4232 domain-containing protein [Streptomyces angustmyceticus]|uniref:DUF4232 domain-containing protein n=1 Tax=Streptomyces angustmyceticus TaxID=285578 RepID=UPI0038286D32
MPITTTSRTVTATALAAAALTLITACHDTPGSKADNPLSAVSPAPAPAPDDANPPDPGGRVACTPEMLRFHAGALPHRDRRMLLKVTNFSGRTCDFAAQRYPLLRFGEGRQAALPAIRASRPLTVVSLAPGDTAYAMILTSAGGPAGRGHRGRRISQFGVALTGRAAPTQVGLDGRAPVHVDPRTATVTYWQPSSVAARQW